MKAGGVQKVRFAGLKRFVTAAICHPLVGRAIGVIYRNRVPSNGLEIITGDDIDPRVKAYLFWGIYESAEIRFIHQYLGAKLDVIELGSSLGVVSCHIARKLMPDRARRLICVEANPYLRQLIANQLNHNVPEVKVTIVSAAIDYSCAPGSDDRIAFGLGATNLDSSVAGHSLPDQMVEVETVTLGALIEREKISAYALVSDIEGAELGIFLHDHEALCGCRQIIIELHEAHDTDGNCLSVQSLIDVIESVHGFRLTAQRGPVCVFVR